MICHCCGGEIKVKGFISRTEECSQCGSDIHCCKNCQNYDTAAHNRCREPLAEWVSDREKANFCDYFTPNKQAGKGSAAGIASKDARAAFENLFKK